MSSLVCKSAPPLFKARCGLITQCFNIAAVFVDSHSSLNRKPSRRQQYQAIRPLSTNKAICTTATGNVLLEVPAPGIASITLNRPKALNALNVDLLSELVDALRQCQNAKVIILQGAGNKAFCAGADLKETLAPKTGSAEELREAFEKLQALTRLTASSPALVITAVDGFAVGGGAEIALTGDFVIGGPTTKFRFPEVALGYAATGGITQRLPMLVGLLKAKELLLTGRMIDAEESLKAGVLSEIAANPKARALELAHSLAGLPRVAASSSKLSLERAVFPNQEAVLQDEIHVAALCFAQHVASNALSNSGIKKSQAVSASDLPPKDLNTALARAVSDQHSKVFLRFGDKDYTFEAFEASVAQFAGALRCLGVKAGDRVLVMMRNSIEMVQSWFATNRLGAVWVPINPELKSTTLKHVIECAAPKIALADTDSVELIRASQVLKHSEVLPLHALPTTAQPVKEAVAASSSTTSAFLFTSGTSGRSKPCVLTHGYFLRCARTLSEHLGFNTADVLYTPFPLFHIDATALTVIPALLQPCVAAISTRYSASNFWDEIRASKATVYDFMGATLAFTFKQPPAPFDTDHSVRLAWGVPVPTWANEYEKRFNHRLVELYGSCEAGIPVIQQGPRVPGSCGKAVEGCSIRIADHEGYPVPPDTEGDLLVRCDVPNAVFSGYFGDPAATAEALRDTWLRTGDRGRVDQAGNLFYTGRTKDVIRRRGENINTFEIEEELLAHPEVLSVAAFAIPAESGRGTEDEVKVAVVPKAGAMGRGFSEEVLWKWAFAKMARSQVPSVVQLIDELQRTSTGKVEKWRLSMEGGKKFDVRTGKMVQAS